MPLEDYKQKLKDIQQQKGPHEVLDYIVNTLKDIAENQTFERTWLKIQRLGSLISLKKFEIADNEFLELINDIDKLNLDNNILKPLKGDIFRYWGISLGSRGFFGKAVEKYQKSHEMDPNQTASLNNIGLNLIYLGRWEVAEQVLNEGLANTPNDDELGRAVFFTNLGELYRRWDKEETIRVLKEAIPLHKKMKDYEGLAEAAHSLIRWYLDRGDLEKAEPLVKEVLAIKPSHLEQYCSMFQLKIEALWALANQKIEQVIKYYKSALDLTLEIPAHEHVMGVQYDLALVYLQEAIKGNQDAIFQLRELLTEIVTFAERNNLQFILIETLMVQTKVTIWIGEYFPAYSLLNRIKILIEKFPYEHLQERINSLEKELETLNPKSSVQYAAQLDDKTMVDYFKRFSKLSS